jgi:flagellar basal-body rod protein FlgB
MDLFQLKLFQRLSERMSWLGARQQVLAQNVANADTPDYQPHDLKELDFKEHLRKLAPVAPSRTDPQHMAGTAVPTESVDDIKQRNPYEAAPVENAVVLEEQMMRLADAQHSSQLMTNLYRKHVDMLKSAIGRV